MRDQTSMSRRSRRAEADDPTVYPEEERVGEEMLQRWIAELLRPLLERWLNQKGVFFVGADQFIYWQKHDPHKRWAPDIYVLPGVPPDTRVHSWKTWQTGLLPSFALEVVSGDWEKDYAEVPERAAAAGIAELVVFDPGWAERPGGVGSRWQVFRRAPKGGLLRRIEATDDDRVPSRALGCWLRVTGTGDAERLRIGVGKNGDDLVPTGEEAERAAKEAERAAKEAALAAKEVALAAKEAERAAKEAALAANEGERAAKEAALAAKEVALAAKEAALAANEGERAAKEAERAAKETALARVAELERELAKATRATGTRRSPPRRRPSKRRS